MNRSTLQECFFSQKKTTQCSNLLVTGQATASNASLFSNWNTSVVTLDEVLYTEGESSIHTVTAGSQGYEGVITNPTDALTPINIAISVEVYPATSTLNGVIGLGELQSADPSDLDWVLTPITVEAGGWSVVTTTKAKAHTGKYRIYIGTSAGAQEITFNTDKYMLNTGTTANTWCQP